MTSVALSLQVACTFYLLGVIWIIHTIHYPSFGLIHPSLFKSFHQQHVRAMTFLVAPAMVLEVLSFLALSLSILKWPAIVWNSASLISLWTITFVWSVPAHSELSKGFDSIALRRLLTTNRLRVLLWTLRAGFWMGFLIN